LNVTTALAGVWVGSGVLVAAGSGVRVAGAMVVVGVTDGFKSVAVGGRGEGVRVGEGV
jgi:hypothetical protein